MVTGVTTTTLPYVADPPARPRPGPAGTRHAPPGRLHRLLRGPEDDPVWARPLLVGLLVLTGLLYLWGLGASGWANTYYSAAVQAASKSWKAFLFGSLDSASSITVDKSPAFLWPMDLAARAFGVSSWSILVPQAVEGVAAVAVLYAAVRRWFSPAAALLSGLVLALTPVAALMFRFNNPDALLTLLTALGAYAMVRALEGASTRWVVAAGSLAGLAFLAKMLQALLVVPALGLVYLVAAPTPLARRVRQLLLGAAAMVLSAGWWVAIVVLTPATARPYIGGSQNNSLWNLVFGYNGLGRLSGNESGSVGGGPGAGRWGPTGWTRLFNSQFGGEASWLLPGALILLAGCLVLTLKSDRADRTRASMILWGGWLVVTGAAISLGKGIIHPYYTVALAPPIGAIAGIGATELWRRRHGAARFVLSAAVAATAWWSYELLGRTPSWHPGLRSFVLVAGWASAAVLATRWTEPRHRAVMVAGTALAATLAGPAAYTWATAATPHSGAIPSSGPAGARGPGGLGRGPGVAGAPRLGAGPPPGAAQGRGRFGGFGPGGLAGAQAPPPNMAAGQAVPGAGTGGTGGGGIDGILDGSRPSAQLARVLEAGSGNYTWTAATVSANQAAGYQLATGKPVMALGGFNGTDPSPTLAQFQSYVREGKIHYFITSGLGRGPGGPGGGGGTSSEISAWVQSRFSAQTVAGVTLYDLTSPVAGSAAG
ncbi:MAG: glycosyltransferase family 39 protein [Actinobacteria bacterium]|nr:MAG: glycosyltransferase family 39 protein [Actinomycetota bacterium]